MGFGRIVKQLAATVGIHLQRQSDNPAHNLLGLRAHEFRSVIDIGANRGQFAMLARRQFPAAHIHSFEPLTGPFTELASLAQRVSRVSAYNIALGEVDGQFEMFQHQAHSPSSSLLKTTRLSAELFPFTSAQATTSVMVRRLDGLSATLSPALVTPMLVKLDVQGFEAKVIRGGRSTLAMCSACIVEVSIDTLYEGQATFAEIFHELDGLGFRYTGNLSQVYAGDGHVIYIDAVFRR